MNRKLRIAASICMTVLLLGYPVWAVRGHNTYLDTLPAASARPSAYRARLALPRRPPQAHLEVLGRTPRSPTAVPPERRTPEFARLHFIYTILKELAPAVNAAEQRPVGDERVALRLLRMECRAAARNAGRPPGSMSG